MDILNDYYPLYGTNPESSSESEQSENNEYIKKLDSINQSKKRKKTLTMDDFCLKYGDDMWYIWCIVHDYSHNTNLLDKLDYPTFCEMCYNNSTRY